MKRRRPWKTLSEDEKTRLLEEVVKELEAMPPEDARKAIDAAFERAKITPRDVLVSLLRCEGLPDKQKAECFEMLEQLDACGSRMKS